MIFHSKASVGSVKFQGRPQQDEFVAVPKLPYAQQGAGSGLKSGARYAAGCPDRTKGICTIWRTDAQGCQ